MLKSTQFRPALLFCVGMFYAALSPAQNPMDAWMMKKGEICTAVLYGKESWTEYWEGTLKRDNGNIGTFTRQNVMPMFALGITDKINAIAALPWVKTGASAGTLQGISGWQDWGLWIKGELLRKKTASGELTLHAVGGITGPATNYLPDYLPFSLGLGCYDASLRGIAQYQLNKGLYARAFGAYHLRSDCTIERDYYYTTQAVYSDKVDMPNAASFGFALGNWWIKRSLKTELLFDGMNTLGGFDIRRQDMPFPSNRMNFNRLGLNLQYYLPRVKGLGFIAGGNYVLSGRNMGQSTGWQAGLTYQFNLWK